MTLVNTGDTITLTDDSSHQIDQVSYTSSTEGVEDTFTHTNTGSVENATQHTSYASIQDAVSAANANDTISITGTQNVTSAIAINVPLTIEGVAGAEIDTTGSSYVFSINPSAAGTTISGITFNKTDTVSDDAMILVDANNVSIESNVFESTYDLGGSPTIRGLVVSGVTGVDIGGSTFTHVRQPGYINNATGTVHDNETDNSKGWVVVSESNITFMNNSWGTKIGDIAIVKDSPVGTDNYSDIVAISKANNDAVVEDQMMTPPLLSVVYVDANAAAGGNGTKGTPYQTIQDAMTRVITGGTVHVAAGTYSGDIAPTVDNLTIVGTGNPVINLGSGYGIDLDNGTTAVTGFTFSGFTVNASPSTTYALKAYKADGLTLSNDTFNGGANNSGGGVDINTSKNVTLDTVTSTGFHKNGFADTSAYAASDTAAGTITFNNVTASDNGWTGISFYTTSNSGGAASINGVSFTGSNVISGNGNGAANGTGIHIQGDTDANEGIMTTPAYTVTSDGTTLDLTHVAFSSNAHDDIVNYQTAPVNAIGATFGGMTGDAMSASERTAEDGLIYDHLDAPALGLVSYYTPAAPVAPNAPTDLFAQFQYDAAHLANNTYLNKTASTTGNNLELQWTAPSGTVTSYHVVSTYPNGSMNIGYQGPNTNAWLVPNGFGGQGDGEYDYVVKAVNGNGTSASSTPFTLYYDATAPVVNPITYTDSSNATQAAAGATINGAVTFHATQNELYPYRMYVEYDELGSNNKWQKLANSGYVMNANSVDLPVDTTKWADGTYQVKVSTDDKAGNHGGGSAEFTVNNSITAAPTNLTAKFQYDASDIANGTTLNITAKPNKNNLELEWTAPSGNVTGYHILETYPDSTTGMSYQGPNTNAWLAAYDGFGAHGNGEYDYQVVAVNANGTSTPSQAFTLYYDTHSPTAAFSPVPPRYVNGNFAVSGTANDNVALKSVLFDVRDPSVTSGNSWAAGCTSGSTNVIYDATKQDATASCTINTANLTEGHVYVLRIHASDNAGYGSSGQQQDLIVDRTRPNATITAPANASTETGAFTITGTATDTLSGIDHVNIYVSKVVAPDANGKTFGGYVVDGQPATWDAGTGTFTYDVTGLADGTYAVKADAFDKAGNDHFANSPTITVQNIVPVFVTTHAATGISLSDATLNGTNGDDDATGHSFWISTGAIDTSSPNIPAGVYSTPDLGGIAANTDFSSSLASLTTDAVITGGTHSAMPAITPDTTYNYVAWSDVGGTWHPGSVLSFVTPLETPSITSPSDGEATTTVGWQDITWTSVSSTNAPVTYTYQVSDTSDATSSGGSFSNAAVTDPNITTTSIPQGNTGDGTYYMHVMATDAAGNTSAWSPTVKVIVDNSGNGGGTTPVTPVNVTSTSTVTMSNYDGWVASSASGGDVAFVADQAPALGNGSLELITGSSNDSVTHFTHDLDIPLKDLSKISYESKQLSAANNPTVGNATLRLSINLDGNSTSTDDQLMYEPYYNGFNGSTGWNTWTITRTGGKLWSNGASTYNGLGGVSAGSYASNFTLADVLHDHPNATIVGAVLSMGTWNPSQTILVDNLMVGSTDGTNSTTTIYDFEPRVGTQTVITNAHDLESNASTVNQPYTVQWSVTPSSGNGTPTGMVNVYVNGSQTPACSDDVAAGHCDITPSSTGSVELVATYEADNEFDQSTSVGTVTHEIDSASNNNNGGNGGDGGNGSNGAPGTTLIGDLNHDGRVNFIDLAFFFFLMGSHQSNNPADFNNDGSVDLTDLALLYAHWTN